MKEIIINNWLKTYLIGAMSKTKAKDGGAGWRESLQIELEKRIDENDNPIYIFNPCTAEQSKVGLNPLEYHKKINGWLNSGHNDKVAEGSDLIWEGKHYIYLDENNKPFLKIIPGDDFYVEQSNFLICKIDAGDSPCLAKNTKVLMSDWSQKNIQDVKVGDEVLGFKKLKNKTKLVKTKVYNSQKSGFKKCLKINDNKNNTIYATPEHKFLTRNKKHGSIYKEVQNINNVFSIKQMPISKTYLKGWLTGYLQNDGCFQESWSSHQVIIVTDKLHEIKKVQEIYEIFGITSTISKRFCENSKKYHYILIVSKKKYYFELRDWKDNHPLSFDFKRGWLAGAIDADGYYDKWSIRYSQAKVHIKNRKIFKKYCNDLNIKFSVQKRNKPCSIFGRKLNGSGEYIFSIAKSYAFFIPTQFDYKRKNYQLYLSGLSSKIKSSISSRKNVYDLTTGTGNFIANGFIVHNCGTFYEAGYCRKLKKPIYVIQTMRREEYPESFVGWVFGSGGDFFPNQSQLLDFLDKKYKLKVKKGSK